MDPNLNYRPSVKSSIQESSPYRNPQLKLFEAPQNRQFSSIEDLINSNQNYNFQQDGDCSRDEQNYSLFESSFKYNYDIQEPKQAYKQKVVLKAKTITDEAKKQYQPKKVGCSCKKQNCTSKYCCCLKKGSYCVDICRCENCQNIDDSKNQQPKGINEEGCKCKKKKCQKGYCDCFAKNSECNSKCTCSDCQNRKPIEFDQKKQINQ